MRFLPDALLAIDRATTDPDDHGQRRNRHHSPSQNTVSPSQDTHDDDLSIDMVDNCRVAAQICWVGICDV